MWIIFRKHHVQLFADQRHVVVGMELKGPDNSLRVRQIRMLGEVEGGSLKIGKQLSAQTIQQRNCEAETLKVFRLITSQVNRVSIFHSLSFGRSSFRDTLIWSCRYSGSSYKGRSSSRRNRRRAPTRIWRTATIYGNTWLEYCSAGAIWHIFRNKCALISYKRLGRRPCAWGRNGRRFCARRHPPTAYWATTAICRKRPTLTASRCSPWFWPWAVVPWDNITCRTRLDCWKICWAYCTLDRPGCSVKYVLRISAVRNIKRETFLIVNFTFQVTSLLRRILPEIKPETLASVTSVERLPPTDFSIVSAANSGLSHVTDFDEHSAGILDVFLSCIAKALTVQVKAKGKENNGKALQTVSLATSIHPKSYVGTRWWLRGCMTRKLAEVIIQLLKDMASVSARNQLVFFVRILF